MKGDYVEANEDIISLECFVANILDPASGVFHEGVYFSYQGFEQDSKMFGKFIGGRANRVHNRVKGSAILMYFRNPIDPGNTSFLGK